LRVKGKNIMPYFWQQVNLRPCPLIGRKSENGWMQAGLAYPLRAAQTFCAPESMLVRVDLGQGFIRGALAENGS
jgi:hypothetical protein